MGAFGSLFFLFVFLSHGFLISSLRAEFFPPPPPPIGPVGGPPALPPPPSPPPPIMYGGPIPAKLSETGLYSDFQKKTIAENVAGFTPQYPLWSDGARKQRWIYLPPNTQISTKDPNRWVFPVGTKLWKEFSFQGRRVETRYFEKVTEGEDLSNWYYGTYAWNESQDEAVVVSPLGRDDAAPTGYAGVDHRIPSHGECFLCHGRGGDPILGFDLIQLSTEKDPHALHKEIAGPGALTNADLQERGKFTHSIPTDLKITASSPEGRAAMGYLHGNCGHCHNPSGVAKGSFFFNRFQYPVKRESQNAVFKTGVDEMTFKFHVPGRFPGLNSFRIQAGSPKGSAVIWLMSHRSKFAAKMPPIGTSVVDEDAVLLLKRWIRDLED